MSVLECINLFFIGMGIFYVVDIMNVVIIMVMFFIVNLGFYGVSCMIYGLFK